MIRFAVLCPPYAGHLNPMLALARGLARRGHAVTFVAQSDVGSKLPAPVGFRAVGASTHPPGTLDRMTRRLSRTTGVIGVGGVIRDVAHTTAMLCRDGPDALLDIGAEAVIADQTEAAGGLLARRLGLPQVSVANALLINREATLPPPFVGWGHDATEWGIQRNGGGYRVADLMMRPLGRVIRGIATEWNLGPIESMEACLSPTLQISQTIDAFDFPRRAAPPSLAHVGPLREDSTATFEPPDERPLVFCSLGTLQGSRFGIFETVARACAALNLSLVITHGGKLAPNQVTRLTGAATVAAYLPQRAIMARAAAVVTHGGLNTVLDALAAGVPLIVLPIAFEQGAIAARVAHCGAGLALPSRWLTPARLGTALQQVLEEPSYKHRALFMRQESSRAGGVERAVTLIEAMIATYKTSS